MIHIPDFMYKISFLKNWENLHHYLTFFERTLFRILLFALNLTENLAIYLLANVRTNRAHNPKKNDAFYKTFYMYVDM